MSSPCRLLVVSLSSPWQDHVYELLNTIDANQCFFDIVSDTQGVPGGPQGSWRCSQGLWGALWRGVDWCSP